MAERKSLDGLTLTRQHGTTLMALAAMEIWDGADLSLLRDGLNHVILQNGSRSVAIDMSAVKYVPSGFFGMLFDWFDQKVTIRLFAPQERVRNMLWFRQFFRHDVDAWYLLHDGLKPAERDAHEIDTWQDENWDSHIEAAHVTAEH
jgi:anti-anti-sigma regulatory factor